ncbi:MAG: M48 family metallopeptidase [Candidatus Eisenbacteria bacterium]|nr:M48 family metallopeptidase [Candidatus Eisenbacteria bacterium]
MGRVLSGALLLGLAALATATGGCATVPITGRSQLSLLPEAEMVALGEQSYREVLAGARISTDQAKTRMVAEVGANIARSAETFMRANSLGHLLANYRWEFALIEDDSTANAFCMPGGKIAVYTGILPVTRDATGLAVVVGHEVAHAIANHGGERMSQLLLAQLGGMALSRAVREKPEQTQELLMLAYGVGANVGVLLPYSRRHESEADRIGLILMAQAGYDPAAAVPFWQRMAARGGGAPPEFLSTHPSHATRIEDLRSWLPEAQGYYRPQP